MREIAVGISWLHAGVELLLIILLGFVLSIFIRALLGRRLVASRKYLTYRAKQKGLQSWLKKWMLVPNGSHPAYKSKQSLLRGCGFFIEAGLYMALQRLLILTASGVLALAIVLRWYMPQVLGQTESFVVLSLSIIAIVLGLGDQHLLGKLKRIRRYRIMRDVDVLSRQLLYYSGLNTNFHSKLMRCLPFANVLRNEWYQLTGEWYHNAEFALQRFQERVGTEEGISFAETINALRQYDHQRYYELLKQRIADYKEKLELYKVGRQESMSYLLFVMSGIPIIYTFRVFIYPWVAEGQKLFNSIG